MEAGWWGRRPGGQTLHEWASCGGRRGCNIESGTKSNGDEWGGSRSRFMEKKRITRKRLKQVVRERLEIRLTISTEPRSREVPVQGCNITY